MPAVPTADWSNIVDLKVLAGLVGTDWQNKAVLMQSGVMQSDGRPLGTGTQTTTIRGKLFEGDDVGQEVGIATPLSFADATQTEMVAPIVVRADGATLWDIQGEIQAGGAPSDAEVAMQMRAKAAQMLDTVGIKIMEGCAAANTSNQDGTGATISLILINTAKYTRLDYAEGFQNGAFICRANIAQKLGELGLTAATSNTWGIDGAGIALTGTIPKLQGMNLLVSEKVTAVDANDSYAYLVERGGILFRGSEVPTIAISDVEDGFGKRIKFRIRFSAVVKGMSWKGGQSDIYTNVDLAAAANWELKAAYAKHVPLVRMYTGIS
jgi:hypothetical protein